LLTLGKYEYGYRYIHKFFFFLFKGMELINKSRYGTFLTKLNDIHSFKLIEYIDIISKFAKNKKDEYVNKLTTSMLNC